MIARVLLSLLGVLALLPPAARAAEPKPTVAVFDLELKRLKLDRALVDALNEYLFTQVAAAGRFDLVPKAQLRNQLLTQKTTSYKECFDQRCQIEIGRELAAQKVISVRLMKLGKQCVVGMTLFDLRRAATERAANVKGACAEEGLMASLDKAVAELTSANPRVAGQPAARPLEPSLADGKYLIMPAHSGLCLDVWNKGKQAMQRVIQWECHRETHQQFQFTRQADGTFSIQPVHSGLCLEITALRGTDSGTRLLQAPCDDGANQAFSLEPAGDDCYRVKARHSGKCWDVWYATRAMGEEVIQYDCHAEANQQFRFEDRGAGLSAIHPKHSNLCLDVWLGSKNHCQPIVQWECHYEPHQLFRKQELGGGYVRFVASHSGLCLEVLDVGPAADLQRLQQSTCLPVDRQRFELHPAEGGTWEIRAKGRKSCLDQWGATKSNGDLLVQWACHGGPNQRFRIEPVK